MAVTTGRAVDAAVARAMGRVRVCAECRLPTYSTDDATALTHCVPWLREKHRILDVRFLVTGGVEVRATDYDTLDDDYARCDTLASALCQVVLAVAGGA